MTYYNTRPTRKKTMPPKTTPPTMRGLGDLIEKVTEKTGKDCGCGKRRDKLNKAIPFGGKS
jgi:hypothetical protein